MSLTSEERAKFTAGQLAEIDRLCADCFGSFFSLDTSEYEKNEGETTAQFNKRKNDDSTAHRAKVHGSWTRMTKDQLKARVNLSGFRGSTPVYSEHDNYTSDEKDAISWGYKSNAGRSWAREIPAILEHYAEMKADVTITPGVIKAILRARGGN